MLGVRSRYAALPDSCGTGAPPSGAVRRGSVRYIMHMQDSREVLIVSEGHSGSGSFHPSLEAALRLRTGSRRGTELAGISAVVPTVFAGTKLDADSGAQVVEHLLGCGVTALTAMGLASEPWALTRAQRAEQIASVVAAADGRVPVLAGVGGSHYQGVASAVEMARAGVTHLMVLLPPEAIDSDLAFSYLELVHDETGLPLVLQDAPQLTGKGLAVSTIQRLVEDLPALVSVKLEGLDCGPEVSAVSKTPVTVLVGWGGINLPDRLGRGASGCMPGAGTAPTFARILEQWSADQAAARETYEQLLPLLVYASQSLDLMIATTKRILGMLGVIGDVSSVPGKRRPDPMQLRTVSAQIDHLISKGVIPGNATLRK